MQGICRVYAYFMQAFCCSEFDLKMFFWVYVFVCFVLVELY